MWIGSARLVLDFYPNDSLRIKRRKIEELCKDIRRKYNISALEVADFDLPEKCVIGLAMVMPETWGEAKAMEFVQNVVTETDKIAFARITVEDCELFSHGE